MPPKSASKQCLVCGGSPVQFKYFSHPQCSADANLVVKATCTKCIPPKEGHEPEDVVRGFYHKLVGKVKLTQPIGAPKPPLLFQLGWDEHLDIEKQQSIIVRPYLVGKQQKYTKILRAIKWNPLTTHYIYPDEAPSCPLGKKPLEKDSKAR